MGNKKPTKPIKTKNFIMTPPEDVFGFTGFPWEIRRRPDKKDPYVDTESVVAKISFSASDAHQCSEMCVDRMNPEMTKEALFEVMNVLCDVITSQEAALFIQSKKDSELSELLTALGFSEDPADETSVIKEKALTSYLAIFLCIGMSVGMAVGGAGGFSTSTGMCLGMAIGVALGMSLTASEKKKREALREERKRAAEKDN